MGDKAAGTDRSRPTDQQRPVDPAGRGQRPDLGRTDPPGSGTKNETWKEGPQAKPEHKPETRPDAKPQARSDAKPSGKPQPSGASKPEGGGAKPSGPPTDRLISRQELVTWRGRPAPKEGGKHHTSRSDQKRAQEIGKRQGGAGKRSDAAHVNPASQTRPGERPLLRSQPREVNRADGRAIAKSNVARREWTSKNPETPLYTRPKAGGPRGPGTETKPTDKPPSANKPSDAKPGEPKPGQSKPIEAKPGEPKPGQSKPIEAKPGEPKPGQSKPIEAKPGEPRPGAPKSGPGGPGALEGLAGKLGRIAGVIGEAQMIKDVAEELEWRNTLADPKWGNERTDMFGDTWYRSPIEPDTWTKDSKPPSA